jgi:hypothetical protein
VAADFIADFDIKQSGLIRRSRQEFSENQRRELKTINFDNFNTSLNSAGDYALGVFMSDDEDAFIG